MSVVVISRPPVRPASSPPNPYLRTLYVDGTNGNNGNPGTIGAPWLTIAYAQGQLLPGDLLYVRAGTYTNAGVVLGTLGGYSTLPSGTAGFPITIAGYPSETVEIHATTPGAGGAISLLGHSYLVFRNLLLSAAGGPLAVRARQSAHCEFDNLRCVTAVNNTMQFRLYDSSTYNWVHDCEFAYQGTGTTGNQCMDIGTQQGTLDGGSGSALTDETRYNLIEDNHFHNGGHHIVGVYGHNNVFRNNHCHGETSYRILYLAGLEDTCYRNLVEGNTLGYATNAGGMSCDSRHNIIRRNVIYRAATAGINHYFQNTYLTTDGGIATGGAQDNCVYHNTTYLNGRGAIAPRSGIAYQDINTTGTMLRNACKNNILWANAVTDVQFIGVTAGDQDVASNHIDSGSNPLFVDVSAPGGDYFNPDEYDFHLQSGSPCIDAGGALTTIVSASGSGMTFEVANAGFFIDGWGMGDVGTGVVGDRIQLLGTVQRATVTAVDYDTNMITVDTSLTWTQNQGIALAFEGVAPDVGAYEYGAA